MQPSNGTKIAVAVGGSVLVIVIIFALILFANKSPNKNNTAGNTAANSSSTTGGIDYNSGQPQSGTGANPNITGPKQQVSPHITNWSEDKTTLYVNGTIDGVSETGGQCIVKFTLPNTQPVTGSSTASEAVSSSSSQTICGVIAIPLSSFIKATWTATLSYVSNTSVGTSQPQQIYVDTNGKTFVAGGT